MAADDKANESLCLYLADLLSLDQDSIDERLADVAGTWWFHCDCECEVDHARLGLLLIARHAFERFLLASQATPGPAPGGTEALFALAFLMIESRAFTHFPTFREQSEYERPYAVIWLLLGRLAREWREDMVDRGRTVPALSIADVFRMHATPVEPDPAG